MNVYTRRPGKRLLPHTCTLGCILAFSQEAKMKGFKSILSSAVLLGASFVPVSAQWLHYPTPGIPRTPDGKPNLSAPAPKTPDGKPDLSGIWTAPADKYFRDLGADGAEVPMLPWAA